MKISFDAIINGVSSVTHHCGRNFFTKLRKGYSNFAASNATWRARRNSSVDALIAER